MNRWAAFQHLCDLLAPSPTRPLSEASEWDWQALVALASEHLVTPALALPVERLTGAPDEAKEYFRAVHAMNQRRDETILMVLAEILSNLRDIGIKPLLLKGAASLVTGLYDNPADRILSDLDLLVALNRIDDAVARLHKMGYRPRPKESRHRRWVHAAHHIAKLIHPRTGVGVELHMTVVGAEFNQILPVADIFARADTIEWRGREVMVPSATDRLVHNITHHQLQDGHASKGSVQLRQLRELAFIAGRHNDAVDWSEVETRFDRAGHSDVLQRQAAQCLALMGVRMPVDQADAAEVMSRLRANVIQGPAAVPRHSQMSKLRMLSNIYLKGFTGQPRLALNLLNPLWWPGRIRGILDFLRRDELE